MLCSWRVYSKTWTGRRDLCKEDVHYTDIYQTWMESGDFPLASILSPKDPVEKY